MNNVANIVNGAAIKEYLQQFVYNKNSNDLFNNSNTETFVDEIEIGEYRIKRFINEFWTSKQRQANSIHEISYRACFKPQLPRFFIEWLTKPDDVVYDPFAGRGTTIIEAALLGRKIIANDINPLSKILCYPRLFVPNLAELKNRLSEIPVDKKLKADIDLSMFYHLQTESEIVSIKNYLQYKKVKETEDELDRWIRMVATNRLTGHSKGFFSVYTLPPNQAMSQESQKKINERRNQSPDYRDTKKIIYKKSEQTTSEVQQYEKYNLRKSGLSGLFLTTDARNTKKIKNNSVQLTITSPPFLDIIQYADDNWLRCWFNNIDVDEVSKKITMSKNINEWCNVMQSVFDELFRITRSNGFVAFEVGEVRNGKIKLDEYVVKLGINSGFICEGIMINEQEFTKTSNIWGIKNNIHGTNSNRIVIFRKI